MERRISDQAADEAGFWDARLRAPDCTASDRRKFTEWRDADPSHRIAFERLQTIVASFRSEMSRADVRALRDAALRAPRQRRWNRLAPDEDHARARKITATAAAAVATLVIGATIWTNMPETVRRDPIRELADLADRISGYALAQTYQTGIGQRSTVTLADGSTVELNAKTRIKVSFSETSRNVVLVDGQALFHVAKNPQRPFIVHAGDRNIVAVGTAFDVRLDATSMRVTLLEGKVKVSQESNDRVAARTRRETSTKGREREAPAHLSRESSGSGAIFLTPGQQFVALLHSSSSTTDDDSLSRAKGADAPSPALVRAIDVTKVTGWRDGRVFLEDLTLADAVAEMNKYSLVQIRVEDAQLAQLRVNGMFRAGEQQAFITALRDYFPITARRDSDTEIVLAREQQ